MTTTKNKSILNMLSTEYAFYGYIVSFMVLVPFCEFLTECFGIPFISQPYLIAVYGVVGIIMVFNYIIQNKSSLHPCLSDVFFILLIVFTFISYVFTSYPLETHGGFDYDEWIYHFYAYYSLLFAGTMIQNKKLRKNILYTFVGVAAFHCIIALAQTWGLELTYMYFTPAEFEREHGIYGLTQNKNWFGGLSVLFVGVSSGCYLFCKEARKKYLFLLTSALSFYCSMCCKSRLTWAGIFCIFALYIVSFIIMRKKYDIFSILKRFGILFLVLTFTGFLSEICYGAISHNISRSQIGHSRDGLNGLSSNRLYIWRYGLESVPRHWLTGIGLDNYGGAFRENPTWNPSMFYQNKGHNEYIHTLVTQGVFAALNYIIMLVYACITGVKAVIHTEDDEERRITWILLGMFLGYAAQAFFNSSVINVAPYFWITVGLTMPKKHQNPLLRKNKVSDLPS